MNIGNCFGLMKQQSLWCLENSLQKQILRRVKESLSTCFYFYVHVTVDCRIPLLYSAAVFERYKRYRVYWMECIVCVINATIFTLYCHLVQKQFAGRRDFQPPTIDNVTELIYILTDECRATVCVEWARGNYSDPTKLSFVYVDLDYWRMRWSVWHGFLPLIHFGH